MPRPIDTIHPTNRPEETTVFRHVVLLTFTPETTDEEIAAIAEALRSLPPLIPELKNYVVGVDAGVSDGNAGIAVVADCDDQAGWETYRDHPEHQRIIAELIGPRMSGRSAVQHHL